MTDQHQEPAAPGQRLHHIELQQVDTSEPAELNGRSDPLSQASYRVERLARETEYPAQRDIRPVLHARTDQVEFACVTDSCPPADIGVDNDDAFLMQVDDAMRGGGEGVDGQEAVPAMTRNEVTP